MNEQEIWNNALGETILKVGGVGFEQALNVFIAPYESEAAAEAGNDAANAAIYPSFAAHDTSA